MKKSVLTLAAVFTLTTTLVFTGNKSMSSAPFSGESITISLAPVTPVVAEFEEMVPVNDFNGLAPATPAEATFEEIPSEMTIPAGLAPAAPATADFEEMTGFTAENYSFLAPATPAVADFE
ncbi:MAG TPA: hypothetical protein PKG48_04330 [Bacteroidales bacterium]|nr:hypothetical protein [Bacteroidales bacterium]